MVTDRNERRHEIVQHDLVQRLLLPAALDVHDGEWPRQRWERVVVQ